MHCNLPCWFFTESTISGRHKKQWQFRKHVDILNTRNFVEHEVVAEIVNAREQLPQFSLVCKGEAVAPRSTPCCLCGGAAPGTHPVSKHEPVQQERHFSMVQWFAKSTTPQPPPAPPPLTHKKTHTHTPTYFCIPGPVLCLRMPILQTIAKCGNCLARLSARHMDA